MAAEPTSSTYISKIKVGNTTYDIKNTAYAIDTSAGNVITLTGSDGTSVSKTLVLPKITIAASQIDSSGDITFTTEQGEILTNEAYDTVLVDVSALGSTYSAISPIVAHKQSKLAFGVFFAFETMNLNNAKFIFSGIWVQVEDGTTPYTYLGKLYNNQYVTTSTTVNSKLLSDDITLTKSDIGLGNVDNTADANKSVASATKATQDANGNVITTTYATKSEIGDYVAKAGDTMTGTLNVPKINANTMSTAVAISTGTNADSYFQARKFRGEGTAASYYHAVDFGYQNHNQIDFYEYGGVYNFWKNTTSTATTATANLALKISIDTLTNKSYTYTWPNKTGTFALTSDFAGYAKTADLATVATSGSYNDLSDKPTIPTVNDGTLTIKVEGTTKDTFTANQSGNTEIDIKASDLGLSSAMKFLGTSTTEITDGATVGQITLSDGTTVTPTLGNVVLYGNKEFVVTSDSKWEELGDEGSHALKSITINGTGALSGGGTLEANREIKHNAGNAANKTSGLYKFSTDAYSHVSGVTAVTKSDITALGIPAQDTTYTAGTNVSISGTTISATDTTYTAGDNVTITDNVISATDTTYTAGDNITIDSNNKISSDAIIKLQDNGTTTAGVWLAKTDQISAYVDGQVFLYKITKAGGSTTTLNINGLGAKPVYRSATTALTTHYGVGQYILLTYNTQNTCFRVTNFYDSTDTDTLRTRYFRPYAAEDIYRYKFVALDEENRLVPIVTTNQTSSTQVAKTPTTKAFKPHNLWYYNTTSTSTAGTVVIDAALYWQGASNTPWPYNFNESVPAYRLVYLRGTYDKNTDLFTLYNDGSSPCKSYYVFVPTNTASITLSDYFVSGYYYWLIAGSYSAANQAALLPNKELYYFDGTNLTPVSGGDPLNMVTTDTTQTITAPKTFDSDVFFEKARFTEDGALFTAGHVKFGDTVYLCIPSTSNIMFKDESGSYPGDTLATLLDAKQDSISDLSTIRTNAANGATAYTNLNGHTVNSDVPSDAKFTDTTYSFSASNPTLSWGTTSTIGTAGGTTYKVTMPANPNTNQTIKVGTTTFGASDAVTIAGGGDISVAGDSTNKKITISYTKPTIDSSLSTTSTNAVQNSIVTSAINSKADSSALGDQVTFSYDSTTGTLTISPK